METVRKLTLWGKTAVGKSVRIKACYSIELLNKLLEYIYIYIYIYILTYQTHYFTLFCLLLKSSNASSVLLNFNNILKYHDIINLTQKKENHVSNSPSKCINTPFFRRYGFLCLITTPGITENNT